MNSPGQEQAVEYVRRLIREQQWGPHTRVPPIAELAEGAGVAYVTMWKAVQRLRHGGEIDVSRKHGMHVAPSRSPAHTADEPPWPGPGAPLSRQVARRLRQDIVTGRYGLGECLPSVKECAAHYGVCIRTMRAALAECVEGGALCRDRRRYRVYSPPPRRSRLSVLLVSRANALVPARLAATYSERVQHLVEVGCGRRNVGVIAAGYEMQIGRAHV